MKPSATRTGAARGADGPGGVTSFRETGPLERAICLLSLLAVFCSAFHSLIDPDIWFHLRGGSLIAAGGFPRADTISYPSHGSPYVNLHWLFQLLALGVFRIGGEPGLILMVCIVVTATFTLLFVLARRHLPPAPAALLTALGAAVAGERFTARPEVLTFLFLVLAQWLVTRHREGSRRAAWLLPALFLVWVNTEGLFVLGYAVLGSALIHALKDRRLWISSAVCLLVSLVNPYGAEGALHPLVLFTRINRSMPIYSATIGEFLGPFAAEPMHPAVILFPYYLGLIAATLLFSRRVPRFGEILLLGSFIYISLSARRNIALLPLVATPILAGWIAAGLSRRFPAVRWRRFRPTTRAIATAASAGVAAAVLALYCSALATDRIYARAETNRTFGLGTAPVAFPRDAVRFLRAEGFPGPLFHTFAAGSYMTWAHPGEKVFIDGRLEVHSPQHYERYLRMLQDSQVWSQAEAEFGFRTMIIAYMDAMPFAMERLRDRNWAPVYLDDTALILARRTSGDEERIARLTVTTEALYRTYPSVDMSWIESRFALPPAPPRFSPVRLVQRRPFPWKAVNLGQFLADLGVRDLALAQFLKAIHEAPDLAEPRIRAATVLHQMGYAIQAGQALDSAERLFGSKGTLSRSHIVRGDVLVSLGRPSEAVRSYDRFLENPPKRSPRIAPTLAGRGIARLQAGDPHGARSDALHALRIEPGLLHGYWTLGQAEEALGRVDAAIRAYESFVRLGGRSDDVDRALLRMRGGNPDPS